MAGSAFWVPSSSSLPSRHRSPLVVPAKAGTHFDFARTLRHRREVTTSATFPITPLLDAIRASLEAHPRLVLEAPPGAGKTTQVPPALLGASWLGARKILMLEPRRIAARAAAE